MLITQNVEDELRYSITHWFQPIYHLKSNNIMGYEALLRDTSSFKISPTDIFRKANKNGYLPVLDLISIKSAMDMFDCQSNILFINAFPSTLLEKNFIHWWDINMVTQTSIVLELLESEPIKNWRELRVVTKELQARGVKIAVDDMGEGYSFFQQWIELNPDFIKLDKYFSENLSKNLRKQKVVRNLVNLFSETSKIIIEGIETEEDLKAAKMLNIEYGQGYLLGKPLTKECLNYNHHVYKYSSMSTSRATPFLHELYRKVFQREG